MTIKNKIDLALQAMQNFIQTLDTETAYLAKPTRPDNKKHQEIIEKKKTDHSFYAHCLDSLLTEKKALKTLPQEIKDALLEMQQAVNDAVRENALKIKAQLYVTEQISNIFKQAILDENKKHEIYTPKMSKGKSLMQNAVTYSATH